MEFSVQFDDDRWDPDADEEYQAILQQVRTVAPSCLNELRATAVHGAAWESRVKWAIACACGGATGAVLGYPLDELSGNASLKGQFVGPLALRCAACDKVTEMFDSRAHGFNAMISPPGKSYDASYRGEGPRAAARCPKCAGSESAVVGEFTHSHFDHIDDDPSLLKVAQDYFDWFACKATCGACGHEWRVADFELA